ncbi:MAG: hypothetical protein U0166_11975 [Acidobacteriota bacterium]
MSLRGAWMRFLGRRETMETRMYRQGDVLVMRVTRPPRAARRVARRGRIVLAYGEVTGHAHAIEDTNVESFEHGGRMFLRITGGPATLRHEEHKEIALPAGSYQVVRQREYAPSPIWDPSLDRSREVSD